MNNSIPLFVDEKISDGNVTLYLEVNKKKGTIESLSFEEKAPSLWTPFLNTLCLLAKGKKLIEAKKISWPDFFNKDPELKSGKLPFFNRPVILLGQLIDQYENLAVQDLCPLNEEDLVCRCFGVSESEVRRVLSDKKFTDLRAIIDETCAGGGCGSCTPQLKDLLSEDKDQHFSFYCDTGKLPRIDGMTPVEIILKSHDLLSSWKDLEKESFEILELKGRCLEIKLSSDLEKSVEAYLKDNLSREIAVKMVDNSF